MNLPCPDSTLCLLVNPPYDNLSCEPPDRKIFICDSCVPGPPDPPLGSIWTSSSCLGVCVSDVSQEEANQCAYNNNLSCLYDNPGDDPNTRPEITTPDDQKYKTYYNHVKIDHADCPDGTQSFYTVKSGSIGALSQTQADAMAESLAKKRAQDNRICLSELYGSCSTTTTLKLSITAAGATIDLGNGMGAGYNLWKLISGAVPTGMQLLVQSFFPVDSAGMPGGPTITLEGTPSTPGVYTFRIQCMAPDGTYAEKTYYTEVLATASIGSAVDVTLTKPACAGTWIGGSITGHLNPGLNWTQDVNANDIISGTPTTNGVCAFQLNYTAPPPIPTPPTPATPAVTVSRVGQDVVAVASNLVVGLRYFITYDFSSNGVDYYPDAMPAFTAVATSQTVTNAFVFWGKPNGTCRNGFIAIV